MLTKICSVSTTYRSNFLKLANRMEPISNVMIVGYTLNTYQKIDLNLNFFRFAVYIALEKPSGSFYISKFLKMALKICIFPALALDRAVNNCLVTSMQMILLTRTHATNLKHFPCHVSTGILLNNCGSIHSLLLADSLFLQEDTINLPAFSAALVPLNGPSGFCDPFVSTSGQETLNNYLK